MSQNHECRRIISSVARQFGLDQLKPKQIEVISAFVGGDVLCPNWLLVIYAALPFVFDRIKDNFIV